MASSSSVMEADPEEGCGGSGGEEEEGRGPRTLCRF